MTALVLPRSEEIHSHWQQPLAFAGIGLVVGIVIKALEVAWLSRVSANWVGLSATLPFTLMLWLTVTLLVWNKPRRVLISCVYCIVMLAAASWVGWQAQVVISDTGHYVPSANFMSMAFALLLTLVVMISVPFVQAWQATRPHYTYNTLFAYAWNNVHSIMLAAAFATIVFLVSLMAVGLFEMVLSLDNERLFTTRAGGLTSYLTDNSELITLAAFGAGISIIQQHQNVLLRLHTLAFALYRVLAYMFAFIIIGFALLLLPNWQRFLAEEAATIIFLGLVLASLLFLNTLVERGSVTLPVWARYVFGAQILLLPCLTALATYALIGRTQEYGLSPSRFLSLLLSLMVLVYTLSYAVQLLRWRRQWSEGIKVVNPPLALITAVLVALTLTPILDPQAWSVRDQLARLQNGKVTAEQFDYPSLVNKLGRPGVEAAATLQTWKDHPQYTTLLKGLEAAKTANESPTSQVEQALARLRVIPASGANNLSAFATQAQRIRVFDLDSTNVESCYQTVTLNQDCLLVFQDVNGDSKNEAVLLAFTTLAAEADKPARYQIDGKLYLLNEAGLPVRSQSLTNARVVIEGNNNDFSSELSYPALDQAAFERVKAAAEAQQLIPTLPALPDLQIGGQILRGQ